MFEFKERNPPENQDKVVAHYLRLIKDILEDEVFPDGSYDLYGLDVRKTDGRVHIRKIMPGQEHLQQKDDRVYETREHILAKVKEIHAQLVRDVNVIVTTRDEVISMAMHPVEVTAEDIASFNETRRHGQELQQRDR